jgi:hypothetical protein
LEPRAGSPVILAMGLKFGEMSSVSKRDEYYANAAECQRMADTTRNGNERRIWQEMAESWLEMARMLEMTKIGNLPFHLPLSDIDRSAIA